MSQDIRAFLGICIRFGCRPSHKLWGNGSSHPYVERGLSASDLKGDLLCRDRACYGALKMEATVLSRVRFRYSKTVRFPILAQLSRNVSQQEFIPTVSVTSIITYRASRGTKCSTFSSPGKRQAACLTRE